MQRAKAAGGARLGRMAAAALVPVANNYRGRQPAATLARQRPTYARVSDQCLWPAARLGPPRFLNPDSDPPHRTCPASRLVWRRFEMLPRTSTKYARSVETRDDSSPVTQARVR